MSCRDSMIYNSHQLHPLGIHGGGIFTYLGGGFKYLLFSPLPGEIIQVDKYFSRGLKPPTSYYIIHIIHVGKYTSLMDAS